MSFLLIAVPIETAFMSQFLFYFLCFLARAKIDRYETLLFAVTYKNLLIPQVLQYCLDMHKLEIEVPALAAECTKKSESTSREAAECENNLGKSPPVPPEANVMHISERIVDRISTGAADEERRSAYDDYWLEKIACMDKAHSVNSKLDLEEIAKIEKRLRQYVTGGKKCPLDRTLVTQCYVNNKNETLKCGRDVEEFLKCVDAHLYRAVRGANEESSKSSSSKRASYAEKFKRGY